MQHLGTVFLETRRLCLRPFVMADAPDAYHNWTKDEEVTRFLRWPAHKSLAVTESVLGEWIAAYSRKDFYQWAIAFKTTGQVIGTISVVEKDDRIGMVHIGYCLSRAYWNNGIMTEAFARVIAFLFDEVGVNRIESQHDPNNPASGLVMKKCGLQYEGTRRKADFSNQGIVDAACYAILKDDYRQKEENP